MEGRGIYVLNGVFVIGGLFLLGTSSLGWRAAFGLLCFTLFLRHTMVEAVDSIIKGFINTIDAVVDGIAPPKVH